MEYRNLGASGLKVPVLSFGTGTFGGQGPLFSAWGNSNAAEARRLIDLCLEAGANLFDTADVYSNGASEELLGAVSEGKNSESHFLAAASRALHSSVIFVSWALCSSVIFIIWELNLAVISVIWPFCTLV